MHCTDASNGRSKETCRRPARRHCQALQFVKIHCPWFPRCMALHGICIWFPKNGLAEQLCHTTLEPLCLWFCACGDCLEVETPVLACGSNRTCSSCLNSLSRKATPKGSRNARLEHIYFFCMLKLSLCMLLHFRMAYVSTSFVTHLCSPVKGSSHW